VGAFKEPPVLVDRQFPGKAKFVSPGCLSKHCILLELSTDTPAPNKHSLIELLEAAEDQLGVDGEVLVAISRYRSDLVALQRSFLYFGFEALAPDRVLQQPWAADTPSPEDFVYMAYRIQ